jgi:hypothetical protein
VSTIFRRIFAIGKVQGFYTGTPTYLIKTPTSNCINLKNGMKAYEFFWPFVSANLLQILKKDQTFDPNFDA